MENTKFNNNIKEAYKPQPINLIPSFIIAGIVGVHMYRAYSKTVFYNKYSQVLFPVTLAFLITYYGISTMKFAVNKDKTMP